MSFQAMSWATTVKCGSAGAKLVLMMLANITNHQTGQCNPRHKRLAEECEMSPDTLKKHIKTLVDLGFVKIIPQFAHGVQLPNQYVLCVPNAEMQRDDSTQESHLPPVNLGGGGGVFTGGVGGKFHGGGGGVFSPPNNQEDITKNKTDMAICNQTGESEIAPQQAGDAISSKRESRQCTPSPTAKEGASLVSPECPQKEIVALWNEMLPEAVGIKIWTEKRATALRTRWREKKSRQSLDWWKRFFGYVGQSDFLMGRSTSFGRKAFSLSIDWLLKSENFVKVLEGNYHGEEGASA